MPIVFSHFAEVLSREKRGEHLSWLCMFWMIGEIYASAMAWAIIPHYGEFQFIRKYSIIHPSGFGVKFGIVFYITFYVVSNYAL